MKIASVRPVCVETLARGDTARTCSCMGTHTESVMASKYDLLSEIYWLGSSRSKNRKSVSQCAKNWTIAIRQTGKCHQFPCVLRISTLNNFHRDWRYTEMMCFFLHSDCLLALLLVVASLVFFSYSWFYSNFVFFSVALLLLLPSISHVLFHHFIPPFDSENGKYL